MRVVTTTLLVAILVFTVVVTHLTSSIIKIAKNPRQILVKKLVEIVIGNQI